MSIVYDNTAGGQLIIRGPAAGLVELSFPDMTNVVSKMVTLGADGKFAFADLPVNYTLPVATSEVLGGVKQGNGILISADGTISASGNAGVTSLNGQAGDLTVNAASLGLATVATTGDYNDLLNTPTLASVASTGDYNDLLNTPAIPTVPTLVSAFTNDAGYQTLDQVNTAIQAVVGAAPDALNTLEEIAARLADDESAASAMTTTIALKADKTYVDTQLALKVDAASLATVATSGLYSDLIGTPTALSAFTNDAGFLTAIPVATDTVLGGVKQGVGITIGGDGTISNNGELQFGNGGIKPVLATLNTVDAVPATIVSASVGDNTAVLFTADIVVRNATGTVAGGYTLQGVAKRGTGAASLSFTNGVMKSIIAEDLAGLDATAVVNTATGAIDFTVTGDAGQTLSWFADVRTTYIS